MASGGFQAVSNKGDFRGENIVLRSRQTRPAAGDGVDNRSGYHRRHGRGRAGRGGRGGCGQTGPTVTCNFQYSGLEQTFIVPSGVSTIDVTAIGGLGGDDSATEQGC